MLANMKAVFGAASEALAAAAVYALVTGGICAVIFVDMTGGGSLWKTLPCIWETTQEWREFPKATRVIKVPARPIIEKFHEDRILAVFDEPAPAGTVAAVYSAPEATAQRPATASAGAPAAHKSGKTWRRGVSAR